MINIGVVGCGYWGPKHIRVCNDSNVVNLMAVCDLDAHKLKQVKNQYPYIKTFKNFSDFVRERIDAVIIATPVNTHYQLARDALLHDKHVLIEKPITSTSQEALSLIELAEKRKLVLMTGHTYEYQPAVDFLREKIESGDLGDIFSIDAERLNLGLFRTDVNVLWDLAPHDISIILALINEDPITVSARGMAHIASHVYDIAYLEILFANGIMSNIHVSWLHPRKIRQITIVGSKKMVVYDDLSEAEKIHIYDKGLAISNDNYNNGNGSANFSAWPPSYRYGDVLIPMIANAEPLKMECRHFIKCITEAKRPKSDGLSGLRVINILEAADRSLANGGQREKLDLAITPIS